MFNRFLAYQYLGSLLVQNAWYDTPQYQQINVRDDDAYVPLSVTITPRENDFSDHTLNRIVLLNFPPIHDASDIISVRKTTSFDRSIRREYLTYKKLRKHIPRSDIPYFVLARFILDSGILHQCFIRKDVEKPLALLITFLVEIENDIRERRLTKRQRITPFTPTLDRIDE